MAFIPPSRLPAEDRHPVRAVDFSRHRRAWRKPRKVEKRSRRLCFPSVRNPKIRRKVIGCLISGSTLVLVLTICTLFSPTISYSSFFLLTEPPDLALATSPHSTQAVHIVLILLTLILTIIFCHYLIRLCMLAMPSKKGHNHIVTVPSRARGDGYAQPRTPIPIILARDEELGFVGDDMEEEHEANMPTPPPPAYGLWRCSVVRAPSPHPSPTQSLTVAEPTARGSESNTLAAYGLAGGNEGIGPSGTSGCETAELCF